LVASGAKDGFQWLDGSFMEDCEAQRGVPPGDVDVVTFIMPFTATPFLTAALAATLGDQLASKAAYQVDHILIPLACPPDVLVSLTRFWFGLFSHRKADSVWKGMLQVSLNSPIEDAAALAALNGFGTP
jgi:hypothetical protein